MAPGKPEDQNLHQGELGGQLGVMCAIKIMESIVGITTLMVNSCDNISALRQTEIHPEGVNFKWEQVGFISRIFDVYQSIDSSMSLVRVHTHYNIIRPSSTLMTLASLIIKLDTLVEQIMAAFLLLSVKNKYNGDRNIRPTRNAKRLYTRSSNLIQHCSLYRIRNI